MVIIFSSISIALSIFNKRILKIINQFIIMIIISLLFCIFVIIKKTPEDLITGQDEKAVVEITARVLEDSREIAGGKSIFLIEVLSVKDNNSTITSASGKITIASNIKLYRGQVIKAGKKNIFGKYNSFIFIDYKNIEILDWETTFPAIILRKRAQIYSHLKENIRLMYPNSSLLFSALFTGIKENPKGELFTSLRKAGASHILALSGMHLGIISFGTMLFLTLVFGKKLSFIITLLILCLYVFLVSPGPSLTRALIFFTLLGVFGIYGIKVDVFRVLIFCFLIQVVTNTDSAYSLSFQLSYLALGGIILGSKRIIRVLPGLIPPWVRGILAASISAQIFTSVLVLHYFSVIYPVGIISGIILVPIITLFIWIGIAALVPMPWLIRSFLFRIMEEIYRAVEFFADFFSRFPELDIQSAVIGSIIISLLLVFGRYSGNLPFVHWGRSLDGL